MLSIFLLIINTFCLLYWSNIFKNMLSTTEFIFIYRFITAKLERNLVSEHTIKGKEMDAPLFPCFDDSFVDDG